MGYNRRPEVIRLSADDSETCTFCTDDVTTRLYVTDDGNLCGECFAEYRADGAA